MTLEWEKGPVQASTLRKGAILIISGVMQCICIGLTFGYSIIYVEIMKAMDANRKEASLTQSLMTSIMFGGGVFWPGLVRKIGPGTCLIIGSITASTAMICCYFANSITALIFLAGVLAGLGMSICYVCSFIIIAWTFTENRGIALTASTIGSSIGQFLIPYIVEVSIQAFGWRGTYVIMAGMVLQGVVCGVVIYHSRAYFPKEESKKCSTIDLGLLKESTFVMALFSIILIDVAGAQMYFIVDLAEMQGFSRTVGANFVLLTGVFGFVGRLLAISARKMCSTTQSYVHWTYTSLFMGLSYVLLHLYSDYLIMCIAVSLFGVGFGSFMCHGPVVMLELTSLEKYPHAVGYLNLAFGIGTFSGSFFASAMKDLTGDYNLTILVFLGLSLFPILNCAFIFLYQQCWGSVERHQRDYIKMDGD